MTWILILQGVVFALWAGQMFVTMFRLRARAARDLGVTFPGPVSSLRYWGIWLRDPDTRPERRRLAVLTLVLFGLIFLQMGRIPAAA